MITHRSNASSLVLNDDDNSNMFIWLQVSRPNGEPCCHGHGTRPYAFDAFLMAHNDWVMYRTSPYMGKVHTFETVEMIHRSRVDQPAPAGGLMIYDNGSLMSGAERGFEHSPVEFLESSCDMDIGLGTDHIHVKLYYPAAPVQTHVEGSESMGELEAYGEDELGAYIEDGLEVYVEDELEAYGEDELGTYIEDELEAYREELEAYFEDGLEAYREDELEAYSQDELEAYSQDELEAYIGDEPEVYIEDEQEAYGEDNIEAYIEDEQEAYGEDYLEASIEDEFETCRENELEAYMEDGLVSPASENGRKTPDSDSAFLEALSRLGL